MSSRWRFVYAFLGAAPTWALLAHYVANNLPWWPHTFVVGGLMGALTVLAVRLTDQLDD
jgi:hypothetical protein